MSDEKGENAGEGLKGGTFILFCGPSAKSGGKKGTRWGATRKGAHDDAN